MMPYELPREVVWLVSAVLVEAALIDGLKLKVPNWLTAHFLVFGLAFHAWYGGGWGFCYSFLGAATGLALLMPLYMIGGMGSGDVKLLAGIGAWVGVGLTFQAFVAFALVGAVIALGQVAWSGEYARHWVLFQTIGHEILTIRNPVVLSRIAAERKPSMLLLPYGIPMTVGALGLFAWLGMY